MKHSIFGLMAMVFALANASFASTSKVEVSWKYQASSAVSFQKHSTSVDLPVLKDLEKSEQYVTDPGIFKTLLAVSAGTVLESSLKEFEKCKTSSRPPRPIKPIRPTRPSTPTRPIRPPRPPRPPIKDACLKQRLLAAKHLVAKLDALELKLKEKRVVAGNLDKLFEIVDIGRKLAANMEKAKTWRPPHHRPMPRPSRPSGRGPSRPSRGGMNTKARGLNITTGGAQDIGALKKAVADGLVPAAETFSMEGFLSEFDLPLAPSACDKLICVTPAVLVDPVKNKLFVQIGMDSNVTADTFKRKKLNLSVVLDISGSMGATDNTKKSRIEWAKEALRETVSKLNGSDYLSIVLFNSNHKVLLGTTLVEDKAAILKLVDSIQAQGSTNLESGLKKGFELVSARLEADYENRVILISDAGLNTGVTDPKALLRLVTDYSAMGVGISSIGLGLNFNQDFIHNITMSKGGNYLFVNSGKEMNKYFKNFDFLVTPAAYNFKADLSFIGSSAKFVKAYGIPEAKGEQASKSIANVATLFFIGEGGGAILLEYDL
ncbi:MAG: VWA domain-containing protein [Bacteriovoracaceae bacterium]|nr:VWA domain-containing protein [Bacteriovoracaceae bacterium]